MVNKIDKHLNLCEKKVLNYASIIHVLLRNEGIGCPSGYVLTTQS